MLLRRPAGAPARLAPPLGLGGVQSGRAAETLARAYDELNDALVQAAATPATFRYVDLAADLMVSGVWADWQLVAGNRRHLELRCPIVTGEATGVCAPRVDLTGQWAQIHVRVDKIPALSTAPSTPFRLSDAGDSVVMADADPAPAISVIATSCATGLWRYKLPQLLDGWFNARVGDLVGVLAIVLDEGDDSAGRSASLG